MAPRDGLRQNRLRPSIGARLPVDDKLEQLEVFAITLDSSIKDTLGLPHLYDSVDMHVPEFKIPETPPREDDDSFTIYPLAIDTQPERKRPPYKVYETEDLSLTLAERRWGDSRPNRRATYWSPRDIGRIVGEIQDEVSRLPLDDVIDDDGSLKITFDAVKRVGGDKKAGRKLALVPKDGPGYELMCDMHEAVVTIFDRHHKGYQYPNEFIPHVTIGRVFNSVPEEQVGEIVGAAGKLLPVEFNLGPIEFYDTQQITIR